MSVNMTRRQMLSTGTAIAGSLIGMGNISPSYAWPPGPSEKVNRDLTPGPMTVRLGGHLTPEKGDDPMEEVRKLKDQGLTGVYVWLRYLEPLTDSELHAYKSALASYDVAMYEIGVYPNMIHPDEETRQKGLKALAHSIELADKIGGPMVGTVTGSRDPKHGFGVHPDNWTPETWKLTVSGIKQILKDTSGMKACIGMEAQITTNLDGPIAHKRLLDDVGDPRCVVNLDPTNMVSLHNYYHTTELINECFDLLGESIYGGHAKDTYIWPDKQTVHVQEVCPGKGVLDYETYLVRLSRLKWPRTLLPEHITDEEYPEAYAYIRKVAEKIGVKIHT